MSMKMNFLQKIKISFIVVSFSSINSLANDQAFLIQYKSCEQESYEVLRNYEYDVEIYCGQLNKDESLDCYYEWDDWTKKIRSDYLKECLI